VVSAYVSANIPGKVMLVGSSFGNDVIVVLL
jgi:hypothetical protein